MESKRKASGANGLEAAADNDRAAKRRKLMEVSRRHFCFFVLHRRLRCDGARCTVVCDRNVVRQCTRRCCEAPPLALATGLARIAVWYPARSNALFLNQSTAKKRTRSSHLAPVRALQTPIPTPHLIISRIIPL